MAWQILFTGFAVLASIVSIYFAWSAGESARNAKHSEHRLAIMRGQVAGLEAAMMGLDEKHRKLAGRVYADEYWRGKSDAQPELPPSPRVTDTLGECENWAIAQREGPTSDAARCTCPFCEAKRADRVARRAKLRAGVKT